MYAEIIIDITHEKLDRTFEYKVPEELEGHLPSEAAFWFRLETGTKSEQVLSSDFRKEQL